MRDGLNKEEFCPWLDCQLKNWCLIACPTSAWRPTAYEHNQPGVQKGEYLLLPWFSTAAQCECSILALYPALSSLWSVVLTNCSWIFGISACNSLMWHLTADTNTNRRDTNAEKGTNCCNCPRYCRKESLLSAITSTQFGLGDSELLQLSQNVGSVYFHVCDDLSVCLGVVCVFILQTISGLNLTKTFWVCRRQSVFKSPGCSFRTIPERGPGSMISGSTGGVNKQRIVRVISQNILVGDRYVWAVLNVQYDTFKICMGGVRHVRWHFEVRLTYRQWFKEYGKSVHKL